MAIAWERICTYPPQRHGSVAMNVLIDVRKRYLADRKLESRAACEAGEHDRVVTPSAEEIALSGLTVRDFVRRARGAVSDEALELILRTRVDDIPLRQVAREECSDHQRLQCVRWRAERRIREDLLAAG